MSLRHGICVLCVVSSLLTATGAEASSIIIPGFGAIGPFGEPNTATIGQTFKTVNETDLVLDSFSFWADDDPNPDTVDFAAYIMEWDTSLTRATGSVLYASAMQTTEGNPGADLMERFDFLTGGLVLNAGSTYVAFLSSSLFFDGLNGIASLGTSTNTYSDGGLYFLANGSNFELLTTSSWNSGFAAGSDMRFEAQFSPTPVPEPTSLLLLGTGAAGLLAKARRRKKQGQSP